MNERAVCALCGEPMPAGEEIFKYHGYSGPCPKPPLPRQVVGPGLRDWTPGTWRYVFVPGRGTGHRVMTDFHGEGSSFCVTEVNPWQDCQANARLIAAAPDMHDALIAQVECTTLALRKLGIDEQGIADATAQGRAAIAKADERSPIGEAAHA